MNNICALANKTKFKWKNMYELKFHNRKIIIKQIEGREKMEQRKNRRIAATDKQKLNEKILLLLWTVEIAHPHELTVNIRLNKIDMKTHLFSSTVQLETLTLTQCKLIVSCALARERAVTTVTYQIYSKPKQYVYEPREKWEKERIQTEKEMEMESDRKNERNGMTKNRA